MEGSSMTQPQWRWWLSAPLLVLVLMAWCQLHGLALGEHAVSLDISFPWAVKISVGWILAGALLLRFGPALLARSARRWQPRAVLFAAIVTITLASEYWLLPSDKLFTHWSYERGPVHATFAILMLGAWLLSQARRPQDARPVSLPAPAPSAPAMLEVLTGTGRTQVRLDEIECLEADRNYINVHTGQRSYLLRQTLASFEKSVAASEFQRIHRSIIVNRSKIRERRRGGVLVLSSGRTVRISRAFADRLH
jgi:DNA-binding LytR/AlgR family response regulator